MSDIDLKALREAANHQIKNKRAALALDALDVVELIDRLESAERRAEEAEKERDALRKDAERYGAIKRMLPDLLAVAAQGGVNTDEAPEIFARHCDSSKLDAAVDVYMAQEGGK